MLGYQIFCLIYCEGGENNLHSSENEKVLRASITETEYIKLSYMAWKMKNAKTFSEFLHACIGIDEDVLMRYYDVSAKQIFNWKHNGISAYTKQMLAFAILSDYLAASRYCNCRDDCETSFQEEEVDEWDV